MQARHSSNRLKHDRYRGHVETNTDPYRSRVCRATRQTQSNARKETQADSQKAGRRLYTYKERDRRRRFETTTSQYPEISPSPRHGALYHGLPAPAILAMPRPVTRKKIATPLIFVADPDHLLQHTRPDLSPKLATLFAQFSSRSRQVPPPHPRRVPWKRPKNPCRC